MGGRLDEPLENDVSLAALEDAVRLAQMGDFRQAASRYAAFRREFDESFTAAVERQWDARYVLEEGWKWLTRSDAGKFIACCKSLAARVAGK